MKKKTQAILFIFASLCIVVGLAAIAPFAYFNQRNAAAQPGGVATNAPAPAPAPKSISGYPVRLVIPSLKIDVAVTDGIYNEKTKTWTLSRDKAHYAVVSVLPNNLQGNTFLYGHYRPEVFARLHKIAPGAEVQLITNNGHRFTYHYRDAQTVVPNNVDILTYEGAPQLTIQTCTGTWMQDRRLYFFDFVSVEDV